MNAQSRIVACYKEQGRTVCDILALEDSAGFEELASLIERHHRGTVIERYDGPDARRWVIQIPLGIVELHHDDAWGNRLVSKSDATDIPVEEIGNDLEQRLTQRS